MIPSGVKNLSTKVGGKKNHDIMMFALSTCGWCRKTKETLKAMKVEFSYIDVDLLEGDARAAATEEMKRHNPRTSFPTLVIDGERVIIGFDEDELKALA